MTFTDDLAMHLERVPAAPFLFVGSGFSRRYANAVDWKGLLEIFAGYCGKSFQRYHSSADGDLPRVATLIADDFHDVWWEDPRFESQRSKYPNPSRRDSPFKIAIADHFMSLTEALPGDGDLADELELLRGATIEGIITTNYDAILEHLFPDFAVFSGQDELLFHDPQGVGEIYKIHGSVDRPESIVIDTEDYDAFTERNVYLAAKLLTTFVEHPVVFLGYSLSDENVREILTNVARILTEKNISKLQDRLIFVHWNASALEATLAPSHFIADGISIPTWSIEAPNYRGVFEALGNLKRRFPAKVLRQLKEQVYDLVQTSSPRGRLFVMDIDDDVDFDSVDVVIGVGIQSRIARQGLLGLSRQDILQDVLHETISNDMNAMREIVSEVLPLHLTGGTNTPICRYLKGAGYFDEDGRIREDADVPAVVRERLRLGVGALRAPGTHVRPALERVAAASSFSQLVEDNRPLDVLFAAPHMQPEKIDANELRGFLLQVEEKAKEGHSLWKTQWGKCVCLYDYLKNRPS